MRPTCLAGKYDFRFPESFARMRRDKKGFAFPINVVPPRIEFGSCAHRTHVLPLDYRTLFHNVDAAFVMQLVRKFWVTQGERR